MNFRQSPTRIDLQAMKKAARQIGMDWVQFMLDHPELVRSELPRASTLSFSREKLMASLLIVLYPHVFRLKDISHLAGTTDGTLRVWRTKDDYLQAEYEAYTAFGKHMANAFIREIEGADALRPGDPILEISDFKIGTYIPESPPRFKQDILNLLFFLPFFHSGVSWPLTELFESKFHSGRREYAGLAMALLVFLFKNTNAPAKGKRRKIFGDWLKGLWGGKRVVELVIADLVDSLADPEYRKKYSADEIKTVADSLKGTVSNLLSLF